MENEHMFVIQHGVLNIEKYEKYVLKDPQITDDLCRKCHRTCSTLAQSDCTLSIIKD